LVSLVYTSIIAYLAGMSTFIFVLFEEKWAV